MFTIEIEDGNDGVKIKINKFTGAENHESERQDGIHKFYAVISAV